MAAVGAHEVGGAQPPRPFGGTYGDLHHRVTGFEPGELPPPVDDRAEFDRPLLQHRLGARLRYPPGPEVGARQDGVVEPHPAEVADGADLRTSETRQQPPLVERLHGAGGEPQPPGLPGGLGEPLHDRHARAAQAQFTGERQPGRPRADDDDVGVGHAGQSFAGRADRECVTR